MTIKKRIDYILGMITGVSLMIAAWTCTSKNPLNATGQCHSGSKTFSTKAGNPYIWIL